MSKIFHFFTLLLIGITYSSDAFAQATNADLLYLENNLVLGNALSANDEKRINGTPYLFKDWLDGYLLLNDSSRFEDIKINLINQLAQVVIMRKQEGLYFKYNIDENLILGFRVVDYQEKSQVRTFEFLNLKSDKNESAKKGFFEILFSSKDYKFIKYEYKLFDQAQSTSVYNSNTESEYELETEYYISIGGDQFQKVSLRKKSFEKVLTPIAFEKAIDSVKSLGLKWRFEKDVIALLQSIQVTP